jgi:hypothetical protein
VNINDTGATQTKRIEARSAAAVWYSRQTKKFNQWLDVGESQLYTPPRKNASVLAVTAMDTEENVMKTIVEIAKTLWR